MTRGRIALQYAWKLPVCGLTFSVGSLAGAIILTIAGLHAPSLPAGADAARSGLMSFAASPLLALGLAPLAAGFHGRYAARWFALALLAFVSLGVNTAIESSIFTTIFVSGGASFLVLMNAVAAAALAAVLARLFKPAEQTSGLSSPVAAHRAGARWAVRIAFAILAFPLIYLICGLAISPIVLPYYRAGIPGFVLPGVGTMISVQLVRSALFLLASAPAIFLWKGSRRGLGVALGWAFTAMVGLNGLLCAYWLPSVLRLTHSIEIGADSFLYAAVLALLFKPRRDAIVESRASSCIAASTGA